MNLSRRRLIDMGDYHYFASRRDAALNVPLHERSSVLGAKQNRGVVIEDMLKLVHPAFWKIVNESLSQSFIETYQREKKIA